VRRYLPNDPLSVSAIAVSIQSAPTVLPPQLIRCAAPPDTRPRRTDPKPTGWPRRSRVKFTAAAPPHRRCGWPNDGVVRARQRGRGAALIGRGQGGAGSRPPHLGVLPIRRPSLPVRLPQPPTGSPRRGRCMARAAPQLRPPPTPPVSLGAGDERSRGRAGGASPWCAPHFTVLRRRFNASCSRLQLRRWRSSRCDAVTTTRTDPGSDSEQRGRSMLCLRVPCAYAPARKK